MPHVQTIDLAADLSVGAAIATFLKASAFAMTRPTMHAPPAASPKV